MAVAPVAGCRPLVEELVGFFQLYRGLSQLAGIESALLCILTTNPLLSLGRSSYATQAISAPLCRVRGDALSLPACPTQPLSPAPCSGPHIPQALMGDIWPFTNFEQSSIHVLTFS